MIAGGETGEAFLLVNISNKFLWRALIFFPYFHAEVEGMPAWTARLSSNILPQYAVAIASSNLWPGAHTYAAGRLATKFGGLR